MDLVTGIAARFGLGFSRPYLLNALWLVALLWLAGLLLSRKIPPLKFAVVAGLRTLVIILAVCAVAGMYMRVEGPGRPSIAVAVDVSDSMGEEGRNWAFELARGIIGRAGDQALSWIIPFARGSEAMRVSGGALSDKSLRGDLDAGATDISSAIRAACVALPAGGSRRLFIISDGNENAGDARAAASMAGRAGLRIDSFSPPVREGPRAALKKIDCPEEVSIGEKFTARIIAENQGRSPCAASLAIRHGEKMIKEWPVTLQPGTNAFELPYSVGSAGIHALTATLVVSGAESASAPSAPLTAAFRVVERPKVLCLSGTQEGRDFIARALSSRDIEVRAGVAELLRTGEEELFNYDCIVFSGLPKSALSQKDMETLGRYVRDRGGGFILIGGASTGGYRGTVVEDILPVKIERGEPFETDKLVRLCIILVIDKSGSMGALGFDSSKMVSARRAAEELVRQLKPNDMVGIIPFDAFYRVLVPLGPVDANQSAIINRIRTIMPGGDTLVSRPLEEALRQLQSAPGKVKHAIVLTDGQTRDVRSYNYKGLLKAFAASGVTVSAIGIGRDADQDFLRAIALGTGGDYYYVKDPGTLPVIVLEDARKTLERSGFSEEAFTPRFGDKSEMLKGIRPEQVPRLLGHAVTVPKRRAEVALYTDIRGVKDPILAGWRCGLGKTAIFASDAEARWSKEMVGWKMFSKFWTQVLRWTMRQRGECSYSLKGERQGDRNILELQVFSPVEETTSFRAAFPAPGGSGKMELTLHQVAPDTYSAESAELMPSAGSSVIERREEGRVVDRREVAILWRTQRAQQSGEDAVKGNDLVLLGDIAGMAGGELNPALDTLAFPAGKIHERRDLTGWLLPFVVGLLLIEIAVRKFAL